jgi:hypothetical protein
MFFSAKIVQNTRFAQSWPQNVGVSGFVRLFGFFGGRERESRMIAAHTTTQQQQQHPISIYLSIYYLRFYLYLYEHISIYVSIPT